MQINVLDEMINVARKAGKPGTILGPQLPAQPENMAKVVKADINDVIAVRTAICNVFESFPLLADPKINWANDKIWENLRKETLTRLQAPNPTELDPFAGEGGDTSLEVVVNRLEAGEKPPSEDEEMLHDQLEMYAAGVARRVKTYIYDQSGELNHLGGKTLAIAVKVALREGVLKAQAYIDEALENAAGYGKARGELLKGLTSIGWTTAGRDSEQADTDYQTRILGNLDFSNAVNRLQNGWNFERVARALKLTNASGSNGSTRKTPTPTSPGPAQVTIKNRDAELDPFGSPA